MLEKFINMDEIFNKEDEDKYMKYYMFTKGVAVALELNQTLLALSVARRLHDGQHRKSGEPYIVHPLKVCNTLFGLGIKEDEILAAALLHDTIEDCEDKAGRDGRKLITDYGVSRDVVDIVMTVTKDSGLDDEHLERHFAMVQDNPKALLVKLSDRLNNVSTMYVFSEDKLEKYIKETDKFIIPMASYGKCFYPKYTNQFQMLKAEISAINNSMKYKDEEIRKLAKSVEESGKRIERLNKEVQEWKQGRGMSSEGRKE